MTRKYTKRKAYRKLTDEVVQSICSHIELGLTQKKACLLENVYYDGFLRYVAGEKAKCPQWAEAVSRAEASCERFWLAVLREEKVANPRVRAAAFMLGALDPDRYRERVGLAPGGMIVQFVVGPSGEEKALEISQKGYTKQIKEGEVQVVGGMRLPEVVVKVEDVANPGS